MAAGTWPKNALPKEEPAIQIAGKAGQGVVTIGHSLSRIFRKAGFAIFSHMDYMSRSRGGNNFLQIRVGTYPVGTPREMVDIVDSQRPGPAT
jgi:2-oxoglutarate ferredoxin oxidoreductase subunit alpha